MSDLALRRCLACEGGIPRLDRAAAAALLTQLPGWALREDADGIERTYTFDNYAHTMAFVNAVAWIALTEDHHPELLVGYATCRVRYDTHAVGGLTENDFICAAKVDALVHRPDGTCTLAGR